MGFYLFSSATFAPFARGKSFQHAKKLTVSSAEAAERKQIELFVFMFIFSAFSA
jgi:hypothetical protein